MNVVDVSQSGMVLCNIARYMGTVFSVYGEVDAL